MTFSDESYNLRIELDTKDCELSPEEIAIFERDLRPLSRVVDGFPVADLYITVTHHARSTDFHVKTSLVLSGRTLTTGDRDVRPHPAFDRCVRKLVKQVQAYKSALENTPEFTKQQKGTHQDVLPTRDPDTKKLEAAVQEGDYVAFRTEMNVYEEPLRKRVGRWVQRYPNVNAQINEGITINDIVEEVLLNAFENYERRPSAVFPGEWLESLIDPSLRALVRNPDEELENINYFRSIGGAPPEQV